MKSIKYQKKLTQEKTNKRIKAISWGKMNSTTCPTNSEGYLLLGDKRSCCSSLSKGYSLWDSAQEYLEYQNEERKKYPGWIFYWVWWNKSDLYSLGLSPDKGKIKAC